MTGRNGFWASRWRGDVPLGLVFWRDMVAVGTVVNLFATFVALMLLSQGADGRLATAVHLAAIPYNLFLCLAVWRSPQRKPLTSTAAAFWLAAMAVV